MTRNHTKKISAGGTFKLGIFVLQRHNQLQTFRAKCNKKTVFEGQLTLMAADMLPWIYGKSEGTKRDF